MLSDEEKEILINIKEYMQNDIDKGHHKFVYNDLGSDFKCIDCINAIDNVLNLIEKQKNIIDSIKRILEDEELDYCDTLDEIYHFYEEMVNNE